MSTRPGEKRLFLTFASIRDLMNFLLSCLEGSEFAPGSEIYDEGLNRIQRAAGGKQLYQFKLRGEAELIETCEHIAAANGGRLEARPVLKDDNSKTLTILKLLQLILLHKEPMQADRFAHVLLALWGADVAALAKIVAYLWDLGVDGVDVAFIRNPPPGKPSHFLRIYGLRQRDAFHAWCEANRAKVEVYVPLQPGWQASRYYTLWGHRYPVPGLERLADLDRELILLRPGVDNKKRPSTEWITFEAGTVNFFRKAHQFAELTIAGDSAPLVELEEQTEAAAVPIELAIIPKPNRELTRIAELDKQIDRQRRILQDAELQRSRLATGRHEEVYYAYRFDQPRTDELNPRLARLMQQRLGTLAQFEYAFCRPRGEVPYHLVIANRTQRHTDFSLQPADRVYYQPAPWRRAGVNLFLPIDAELAPRVDSDDAIPLLLRLLEQTRSDQSDEAAPGAAVLWDPGDRGTILQTRIAATAPLLAQYRLLNSFQRKTAEIVERATRVKLQESVRQARSRVDVHLDQLTQDLLQHVAARTEKLEKSYSRLEEGLRGAERLVAAVKPQVDEVQRLVDRLPNDWVAFLDQVLDLHHKAMAPQMEAFGQNSLRLAAGRDHLRALAARSRNLAEDAQKRYARFQEHLTACDGVLEQTNGRLAETDGLSQRATAVLAQIAQLHGQLDERLGRVRDAEEQAKRMQAEIDEIQAREQAAKRGLEELQRELEKWHKEAEKIDKLEAETKKAREKLVADELALRKRREDLAVRREDLKLRCLHVAAQLQQIEEQLNSFAQRSGEMDGVSRMLQEQLQMIDAHNGVIVMWEQKRETWQKYVESAIDEVTQRMGQLRHSIERLDQRDTDSVKARKLIADAQAKIGEAEGLLA